MRIRLLFIGIFILAFLLISSDGHTVPNLISYQGNLSDSSGVPLNETLSITFSIYDVVTGGTAIWNETQSVQVSNGLFNVQLGSVQQLPTTLFMQDTLYLGVQVGSDQEMEPRQQITSAAFAHKAAKLEYTLVPVGVIVAWAKSITGVPALPDGWVECNGQTLDDPDSPLDGQTLPNLNGQQRFLRGNSISGSTGGSTSSTTSSSNNKDAAAPSSGERTSVASDNHNHSVSVLPPYYSVVWIMKIK